MTLSLVSQFAKNTILPGLFTAISHLLPSAESLGPITIDPAKILALLEKGDLTIPPLSTPAISLNISSLSQSIVSSDVALASSVGFVSTLIYKVGKKTPGIRNFSKILATGSIIAGAAATTFVANATFSQKLNLLSLMELGFRVGGVYASVKITKYCLSCLDWSSAIAPSPSKTPQEAATDRSLDAVLLLPKRTSQDGVRTTRQRRRLVGTTGAATEPPKSRIQRRRGTGTSGAARRLELGSSSQKLPTEVPQSDKIPGGSLSDNEMD